MSRIGCIPPIGPLRCNPSLLNDLEPLRAPIVSPLVLAVDLRKVLYYCREAAELVGYIPPVGH